MKNRKENFLAFLAQKIGVVRSGSYLGCILLMLLIASPAWADVVHLKDGTSVEGEIKRVSDGFLVTGADGHITHVPSDKISGIEVKPINSPDKAESRLQSLRRSTETLADAKQAIDRYQGFIKQNAGTDAAHEAEKDLEVWRDRQSKGLVRVGDKWMTPAERQAMQAQSIGAAIQIHGLMKQNRLKDAGIELDKALAIDPQNISLLYLRGVLQYDQEKIPLARKAFEPVATALPDHAPTLNNLAVIIWRQKGYLGALTFYDRALMAAPDSHEIIDNVAEVLHLLTPEQAKSQQAQKLMRHFKEISDTLEKKMAQQGKYRWGSSWVDEKQMKDIEQKQKEVKDQMQKMDAQFAADQQQIRDLERQAAGLQDAMNTMQLQSVQTTPDGRQVQFPLPPAYFQLSQQLATLRQQQGRIQAEINQLRSQAVDVQKKMPEPVFTGIQRIIDADGMPLPAPPQGAAPATQPATLTSRPATRA